MGGPVFEHSEYQRRQEEFIDKLPMDSIVILPNNVPSIRSNDTKYPYRANSYLMYLSGWEEPDSTLVLRKISGNTDVALFVKPRDTESEIWEGRIVGVESVQGGLPVRTVASQACAGGPPGLYRGLKRQRLLSACQGRYQIGEV